MFSRVHDLADFAVLIMSCCALLKNLRQTMQALTPIKLKSMNVTNMVYAKNTVHVPLGIVPNFKHYHQNLTICSCFLKIYIIFLDATNMTTTTRKTRTRTALGDGERERKGRRKQSRTAKGSSHNCRDTGKSKG